MDEQTNTNTPEESNKIAVQSETIKKSLKPKMPKIIGGAKLWLTIMLMHLLLLVGIGYIAFWDQDFNDADQNLLKFEKLREKHYEVSKAAYGDLSNIKGDEQFNSFINDYMKEANNSAGDLQELASQSFNIVLGAFLAFLSATASVLFQNNSKPHSENEA